MNVSIKNKDYYMAHQAMIDSSVEGIGVPHNPDYFGAVLVRGAEVNNDISKIYTLPARLIDIVESDDAYRARVQVGAVAALNEVITGSLEAFNLPDENDLKLCETFAGWVNT